MATTSSAERRLPGVRLARPVVILLIVETVLLYFSTSRLDATIFFRVLRLQAGGSLGATLSVALALVTFALPSILGWLARAWTGAIGLALLPWWLTIILHAGTMLRAYGHRWLRPRFRHAHVADGIVCALAAPDVSHLRRSWPRGMVLQPGIFAQLSRCSALGPITGTCFAAQSPL